MNIFVAKNIVIREREISNHFGLNTCFNFKEYVPSSLQLRHPAFAYCYLRKKKKFKSGVKPVVTYATRPLQIGLEIGPISLA